VVTQAGWRKRRLCTTHQGEVHTPWRKTRDRGIPGGISNSANRKLLLAVTLLKDQAGNSLDAYKIAIVDPG